MLKILQDRNMGAQAPALPWPGVPVVNPLTAGPEARGEAWWMDGVARSLGRQVLGSQHVHVQMC